VKRRIPWPVTGILLLTIVAAGVEALVGEWALGAALLIGVPLVAAMGGPPVPAEPGAVRPVLYRLVLLVVLVVLAIREAVGGDVQAVVLLPFIAVFAWRIWLAVPRAIRPRR
jgi:hypothetical protein